MISRTMVGPQDLFTGDLELMFNFICARICTLFSKLVISEWFANRYEIVGMIGSAMIEFASQPRRIENSHVRFVEISKLPRKNQVK